MSTQIYPYSSKIARE